MQEREREEQAASIDPFAGAETKVKAQVTEPDVKLDKPDGLSDIIWQEFLQWRQGRLEAEREMKECAQELADMQKYHLKIKTEEEVPHVPMPSWGPSARREALGALGDGGGGAGWGNGLPSPRANLVWFCPLPRGGATNLFPHLCMFRMTSASWGSF